MELMNLSTRAPGGWEKKEVKKQFPGLAARLDEWQNRLYAAGNHAVLVIIQGMDASGKDGLIKDVFGGLNPQGISVTSFKAPNEEEKAHDFLWRIHRHCPPKGRIHVFNRSHYEDLIVPGIAGNLSEQEWAERTQSINHFESRLLHAGTCLLKCYLHVSREKQEKRLQERLVDPRKMWKYDARDWKEAARYGQHIHWYEKVMAACNLVPWHIIPADQNWVKNHMTGLLLETLLKEINPKYPGIA